MTWLVSFGLAILVLLGLSACRPADAGGKIDENINIGTHSLHIRCSGKGEPPVVIESGLGDTSERWQAFQSRAAEFTRVCTYDRAGYRSSEPGPLPRNSQQEAEELKKLLENASIRGPYVLVGHSMGGLNVQVFALLYPENVSGLILLDPAPTQFFTGQAFLEFYQVVKGQAAELQRTAEAMRLSAYSEDQVKATYLEAVASEYAALVSDSAAMAAGIESFGELPLLVIGSGKPNPDFGAVAETFQEFWIEQNRELAAKSSHGEFILARESSHYLHEDAPEVVLDAIHRMVDQVSNP